MGDLGAYSLTFGGLLLTAGSAADRLGRRRVLLVGLAVFGLGQPRRRLVVNTTGELIALRAALGIAAAVMAPITNSLVFRLFDDDMLRMRAMTVMIIVGMTGFVLGPLLGGTALAHVRWQWLLVVNAPIALIAWIGVRLGVPADRPEDLTDDALDLPGAVLSVTAIGLACYTLTSGVEHGWFSAITLASVVGAVVAGGRLRLARAPQRSADARPETVLERHGPRRRLAQIGTSIAMASVMFGLILHFQYAYGWSPVRAGLANLPIIVTMFAATPLSEGLAHALRPPHRLPGRRRLPGRLLGGHVLGGRPRLPGDRRLHGDDDDRTAYRHDDLRGRIGRRHAEQPDLTRHRAQRHRTGGRHQHRHGLHRHHDRRPGHHPAPVGVWSSDLVRRSSTANEISVRRAGRRRRGDRGRRLAHAHRLTRHRGMRMGTQSDTTGWQPAWSQAVSDYRGEDEEPGFDDVTVRMTVPAGFGGGRVRVELSNGFGTATPVS